MAKQRVNYVGQVWSACNELEAKSAQFVRDEVERRANPPHDKQRGADDALSTTNEILKQLDVVRTLAISTRFWLGEALYAHFCSFHQLNMDRLRYFRTCLEARTEPEASAAVTKLQDVDARLQRARQSLEWLSVPVQRNAQGNPFGIKWLGAVRENWGRLLLHLGLIQADFDTKRDTFGLFGPDSQGPVAPPRWVVFTAGRAGRRTAVRRPGCGRCGQPGRRRSPAMRPSPPPISVSCFGDYIY